MNAWYSYGDKKYGVPITVLYFVLSHYPTAVPAPTSHILNIIGS